MSVETEKKDKEKNELADEQIAEKIDKFGYQYSAEEVINLIPKDDEPMLLNFILLLKRLVEEYTGIIRVETDKNSFIGRVDGFFNMDKHSPTLFLSMKVANFTGGRSYKKLADGKVQELLEVKRVLVNTTQIVSIDLIDLKREIKIGLPYQRMS